MPLNEPSSSSVVPRYLRAKTPAGLERLMAELNRKDGMQYNFYQIYYAEGFHYAWYLKDLDTRVSRKNLKLSKE